MASINRLRLWCLNALDGHLRSNGMCSNLECCLCCHVFMYPREWLSLCTMWACVYTVCLRYKTVKKCMSGLGWTAAKSNKTWWFSRRSSIMMLIHKWLMLPKMDAKASIASLHVYNMMMVIFFMIVYTIILIPIPMLPAHYVFRLLHEILDNIRFCLLVCLFQLISSSWLGQFNKHTHAHMPIPRGIDIFIHIFNLVY